MALVRVYCGLASAELTASPDMAGAWLTVAIVDDAGRLLDVCEISDDASGYAHLGALLTERSSGPTGVAIAADSDDHLVTMLLTAAGRPLAFADDDSVDDYAERFADDESIEEIESPAAERRAVGLARALQAGVLSAVALPAPRDLAPLKPILSAHAAMVVGRQAAAVALREVLRELNPAALRAYPDPAEPVAMAVLDALPDPGMLTPAGNGRNRENAHALDSVAAALTSTGVADAGTVSQAITALRVAIAETPRRNGVSKTLTKAVAETVRQAVAAVRACDAAGAALISALAERASPAAATLPRVHPLSAVPAPPTPLRPRVPEQPTQVRVPIPRRTRPSSAAPVSPAAVPPPVVPAPATRPVVPAAAAVHPLVPPPPPPGMAPIYPTSAPPIPAAAGFGITDYGTVPPPRQSPQDLAPPGSRARWPLVGASDDLVPADLAANLVAQSGGPDPLTSPDPYSSLSYNTGRVTPPWQADDMPPEPPMLRLVEPPPVVDPALRADSTPHDDPLDTTAPWSDPYRSDDLDISIDVRLDPPPLRLVEGIGDSPLPADGDDGDLLIFAACKSAWFTGHDEDDMPAWDSPMDDGWRAAESAARPKVGAATTAGLPKRVPAANLVPSTPQRAPERPLRIVRDPGSIAENTNGYFSGWRRGREIGGYAVGGRPGRDSEHGWDFSRDERDYNYDYSGEQQYQYQREAAYRS